MHPRDGVLSGALCQKAGKATPHFGGTKCPQDFLERRGAAGCGGQVAAAERGRELSLLQGECRGCGGAAVRHGGEAHGGLLDQPRLFGKCGGCGGDRCGVPPLRRAAGGGQCPRGVFEVFAALPPPYGFGGGHVLRLRPQDLPCADGRRVFACEGEICAPVQECVAALWLDQPFLSHYGVAGRGECLLGGWLQ